ncbi:hypothetical protein ACIN5162_1879 [Acinetobacter baumannii OIFC0162]|uniref:Uncharacterized protein n=3 Tax=Acinetobacter baumannii TaxID=470 RepID=D0C7J1_ACIB2|nr:hypothetical protein HMPREF0010_00721 [Acinetobacter baumannii ATCC 19606 = CIP 70.34 = JCM 6841]EKA65929.1 hypothetical protein ACINWC692_1831 [Acinetobacter baumannii WC-692]EKK06001.1 hypothetical protein ACIN5162_1879 [Acinetobacter baumannii OIFC0162]EKK14606.1 hypothetical protein ACINNAV72_1773 [Acinetobacter baumannii Naval-72]EKP44563.1 hypothetical protein ACIN5111_1824 [Acinetobacter baumannii OIFC111]EKU56238.1 hypothetical protein ACINWC348_1914 [Acinetobacter baumannii WC-348]
MSVEGFNSTVLIQNHSSFVLKHVCLSIVEVNSISKLKHIELM